MSRLLVPLFSIAIASPLFGQDAKKQEVEAIKKEIKEAEAKLIDLRAKLAKAEGEPIEFKDVGELRPGFMKVGEKGALIRKGGLSTSHGTLKVSDVIDGNSIRLRVEYKDDYLRPDPGYVIIKGLDTKQMADGQDFPQGKFYKVIGTEKYRGSTHLVLRQEEDVRKPDPPQVVDQKKDDVVKLNPMRDGDQPKKATPPPVPTTQLAPAKGSVILLGESRQALADTDKPDQMAKRIKDGSLKEISEAIAVEITYRGKEFTELRHAGKSWVVDSKHVPPAEKK